MKKTNFTFGLVLIYVAIFCVVGIGAIAVYRGNSFIVMMCFVAFCGLCEASEQEEKENNSLKD